MDRKVAPEYEEEYEDVTAPVNDDTVRSNVYRITYETHMGTERTVRAQYMSSLRLDRVPDGMYRFEDPSSEREYLYDPEEVNLYTVRDDGPNLVSEDPQFEKVIFPESAPIYGAVQDDVVATVYYWSPLSDELQSVEVEVGSTYDSPHNVSGEIVETGQHVDFRMTHDREIKTFDRVLGRVAAVEFPEGHSFTVNVKGLSDEKAEEYYKDKPSTQVIEETLAAKFDSELDIEVEHNGRIEE